MLTILAKLFQALNSNQSPAQLAAAISFATILGLTPLLSLHNLLILLIVLCFRVNLSLLIISYPLFAFLGYLLSPVFESIGLNILQAPALHAFWQAFYNTLPGRWSNFYYTGVIGSLTVSILLAILLFPISKVAVVNYRDKCLEQINKIRLVRMLKASAFWRVYESFSSLKL